MNKKKLIFVAVGRGPIWKNKQTSSYERNILKARKFLLILWTQLRTHHIYKMKADSHKEKNNSVSDKDWMEMKIMGITLKKTVCQRYFNKVVTHTRSSVFPGILQKTKIR